MSDDIAKLEFQRMQVIPHLALVSHSLPQMLFFSARCKPQCCRRVHAQLRDPGRAICKQRPKFQSHFWYHQPLSSPTVNLTRRTGISLVQSDDTARGRKRKAADHDEDLDSKKRKRKPRDPNAPKRPPSSYILFQNDIRKELKEKHPNVANNELLAMIAKRWNEMTDQDKAAGRVASIFTCFLNPSLAL